MISAGQMANGPQGMQGGYPQQGYGQPMGMQGPYQQQGPTYAPVGLPASQRVSSSPNINVSAELDSKQTEKYLWGQFGLQVADSVNGLLVNWMNMSLAKQAMSDQKEIAIQYYQTQDHIASYNRDVEIERLGVQTHQIDAMSKMHADQVGLEERLAKLSSSTQTELARIQQRGQTERAKVMTANDAFSRRGWDMGMPAIAA